MNIHVMPAPVAHNPVRLGKIMDEFGELHGAIRILALLVHEFPCEDEMRDLIGWQASHVEDLATTFISRLEAHS
jgi:hypothetical protein